MTRTSREDWLRESFRVLKEIGAAGLKIDILASRMGLTKGSFYHHYQGYQDFKIKLLDWYEEAGTLQIIEAANQSATPAEKIEHILKVTASADTRADAAMRAWALQDEEVAEYQERVDQRRIAYMKEICQQITGDEAQAVLMSRSLYAMYIGSLQFFPPLSGEQLTELYEEFKRLYGMKS